MSAAELTTPTLYALNKDGSIQEWNVYTEGAEVVVEFGKQGGKVQQKRTLCTGKNVGRKNETTDEVQAVLEARSKWEKQVRLGYRESTEQLEKEENFSPMLAADYLKRGKSIVYPCYVQPKLDGVRALVTMEDGKPVFNSRGNKTYPIKGQLLKQISHFCTRSGFDKVDGEVYIHGLSLQKISSLAKKWRTPEDIEAEIEKDYQKDIKRFDKARAENKDIWEDSDGVSHDITFVPVKDIDRYSGYSSEDLQYYIFDIPVNNNSVWYDSENPECCRLGDLISTKDSVELTGYTHLRVVDGWFASTEDEARESVGINMQNGFEGSILRNFKGLYEYGQRSTDLQKWKIFQTAEAKVLDSKEDKNGEGVLECIEKDSTTFNCKMKGTHNERSQARMLKLKGRFITFSFQARTDKGVPQFPVGLGERDLDPDTWEPLM